MECAIFSLPDGDPGKTQTAINGFLKTPIKRPSERLGMGDGPPIVRFMTQSETLASSPDRMNHRLTVTVFYD